MKEKADRIILADISFSCLRSTSPSSPFSFPFPFIPFFLPYFPSFPLFLHYFPLFPLFLPYFPSFPLFLPFFIRPPFPLPFFLRPPPLFLPFFPSSFLYSLSFSTKLCDGRIQFALKLRNNFLWKNGETEGGWRLTLLLCWHSSKVKERKLFCCNLTPFCTSDNLFHK